METKEEEEQIFGLDEVEEQYINIIHTKDLQNPSADIIKTYTINKKYTRHCKLFNTMLECEDYLQDLYISDYVSSYSLDKCIEYLNHHKNLDIQLPVLPLQSKLLSDAWTDIWDVEFINNIFKESIECDKLYDIIKASDYLDINALLHLGCSQIGVIIKNSRIDEVDKMLGL
jgi:hypothetical protein